MTFKSNHDLKLILHPYAFILKGGKNLSKNLLDYKLMILQMNCPETIKSPPYVRKLKPVPGKTYSLAKKAPIVQKQKRVFIDNI